MQSSTFQLPTNCSAGTNKILRTVVQVLPAAKLMQWRWHTMQQCLRCITYTGGEWVSGYQQRRKIIKNKQDCFF